MRYTLRLLTLDQLGRDTRRGDPVGQRQRRQVAAHARLVARASASTLARAAPDMNGLDLATQVSCAAPYVWSPPPPGFGEPLPAPASYDALTAACSSSWVARRHSRASAGA